MFHAPWCGHCKELLPKFEGIAGKLKNQVDVAKVDCTVQKSVCELFNIRAFPSLKLYGLTLIYTVAFRMARL
jgi:thioredoxin-like negative regulator of GroEL